LKNSHHTTCVIGRGEVNAREGWNLKKKNRRPSFSTQRTNQPIEKGKGNTKDRPMVMAQAVVRQKGRTEARTEKTSALEK